MQFFTSMSKKAKSHTPPGHEAKDIMQCQEDGRQSVIIVSGGANDLEWLEQEFDKFFEYRQETLRFNHCFTLDDCRDDMPRDCSAFPTYLWDPA